MATESTPIKVARLVTTLKGLKLEGGADITVRNKILNVLDYKSSDKFFDTNKNKLPISKFHLEKQKRISEVARLLNNHPGDKEADNVCMSYMTELKDAVKKAIDASSKFGAERKSFSKDNSSLDNTTQLLTKIEVEINKEFPNLQKPEPEKTRSSELG